MLGWLTVLAMAASLALTAVGIVRRKWWLLAPATALSLPFVMTAIGLMSLALTWVQAGLTVGYAVNARRAWLWLFVLGGLAAYALQLALT